MKHANRHYLSIKRPYALYKELNLKTVKFSVVRNRLHHTKMRPPLKEERFCVAHHEVV